MKKEELKENFKELMGAASPLSEIETLFYKAVGSAVMDIENIPETEFRTAKIIWHAILLKMADQWAVTSKGDRKKVNQLLTYFQQEAES